MANIKKYIKNNKNMEGFLTNISGNNQIYKKNSLVQIAMVIMISEMLLFPFPGFAVNSVSTNFIKEDETKVSNETMAIVVKIPVLEIKKNLIKLSDEKKEVLKREVKSSKRYAMTAYNSDVAQCDASPCITANGFNVCKHGIEDTVAANFLPFGTEIRIPELFGDKIFVVRDRMNSRYTERVDVWLISHENAIDFGVKYPIIEVLK